MRLVSLPSHAWLITKLQEFPAGTGGQVTEPAGSARQGGRPGWLAASEDPEQTQMLATGSFPRGWSRRWLCYTIAEDQEAEEKAYIEQLIQHPKALMPAGWSLRSLGVTAWEPYSYQREALQKLPQRSPGETSSLPPCKVLYPTCLQLFSCSLLKPTMHLRMCCNPHKVLLFICASSRTHRYST